MLKKYLKDIAFMQVLNLLIKPIWIFVIDREVQNALPLDVYGNYSALFNFSLMFFIILDLGLNGYNTTEVSRDERKIASMTGNILGLKMLLMIVYVAVVFVVGYSLGYSSAEFGLLVFLCLVQIVTSMNQYLRTIVSSLQRFKWDGVFMVLDRVLSIVLVAILLWGGITDWGLSIHRFVYAQLAGVGFTCIVLMVFLRSHLSSIKISFSVNEIVPLLKKSWPFAILIALMGLYNYTDSVMLKLLVGDSEAGIYALGYRLFFALLMFAQIFSGVLLPFFSKNINDHQLINLIGSYTVKFLLLVGISGALFSYAYQTEIMDLLYPEKASAEAAKSFSILMFSFIGSALILVFGTLLTAARDLKYLNIAALITLGINLGFNWYLIPENGATGAATATLISQLLFGSICYLLSYQKFNMKLSFRSTIAQVFGVLILMSCILLGKQYFENVYVHFLTIAMSILIAAYLFKLFQAKDLKTLIRK